MSRLFSAIPVPPEVADTLIGLPDDLAGARFVEADDFHLTLRFFGDVDRHVAAEIAEGLASVDARPFDLTISRLDVFGGDRPRALIAVIEPSAELDSLQRQHERVARAAGLEPERRKYAPHITLARLAGLRPQAVADYLARIGHFPVPPFRVASCAMMSSRPGTGGPPYRVEWEFEFLGEMLGEGVGDDWP